MERNGTHILVDTMADITLGRAHLGVQFDKVSMKQVHTSVQAGALHARGCGKNDAGVLTPANTTWAPLKSGELAILHHGDHVALDYRDVKNTTFKITRRCQAAEQLAPAPKRARTAPLWLPTKVALIAKVQEMRDLANATEIPLRGQYTKVYALGNLLTILNDKLPGDDGGTVGIADIDALIRERNIGPATIEWLRQLHASGECDYLAALRLRSSRQ